MTNTSIRANRSPAAWLSAVRLACALALAASLSTLTTGCFAVVVGAGTGTTVAYVTGKLQTSVSANLDQTEKATRIAIGQMQFAQVSENTDAVNGRFIARTAMDKKVQIDLKREGDNVTSIEIRVGVFGDKDLSIQVLDKIKANLGL